MMAMCAHETQTEPMNVVKMNLISLGATLAISSALLIAPEELVAASHYEIDTNARPTLYLIGDSTVNTPTKGQQGWGQRIANLFDTNRIRILNKARGGRSSRTYYTEGLWEE